jgi:hypothetical protein
VTEGTKVVLILAAACASILFVCAIPWLYIRARHWLVDRRTARKLRSQAYYVERGVCPSCASVRLIDRYVPGRLELVCKRCGDVFAMPKPLMEARLKTAVQSKLEEERDRLLAEPPDNVRSIKR